MTKSYIPASIEAGSAHILKGKLDASMLPQGTQVYLTDVGVDPLDDLVRASREITDMGYAAVPHVPARRIESGNALRERMTRLVQEAGVNDILIIAGEAESQMGPYSQTLDILRTGLIDELGIARVGVGGHPEGNPSYGDKDVFDVLRAKVGFQTESDAKFRIVTQFGFNGPGFVSWADSVKTAGIDAPIHLGVAGPAKITTLIKYGAMCGVGNSLKFFKKRTGAITQLATKHSPEEVVRPIEHAWRNGNCNIEQMHIFPFGGLATAADWLTARGSFVFGFDATAVG